MYPESELLPLSALQHLAFCPRQCALIHLERVWVENVLTAEGRVLHAKTDAGGAEALGEIRIVRALPLSSLQLGLAGKADVVEMHPLEQGGRRPFPVEYKRGTFKADDCDRVQLCAQALCLEEMLQREVPKGALYYGMPRRRQQVAFSKALRSKTVQLAEELHDLMDSGRTPAPLKKDPRCKSCSIRELCLPRVCGGVSARRYLRLQLEEL